MRIIYLSTSVIPSRAANSIHVMRMCHALAAQGHEVTLLAMANARRDDAGPVKDPYAFYGVSDNFEIKQLRVLPVKYVRWMLYSAKAFFYVVGQSPKPDLIYARDLLGAWLCSLAGVFFIFESHAPENFSLVKRWLFQRLIRSRRLRRIVVITHALKEHYENVYPQLRGQMLVAPDAADPVSAGISPIDLPNRGKRLQVGYIGHLYKGRGVDVIIALSKRCKWADFHLVGGCERDIERWKKTVSEQTNIIFHGFAIPPEAEKLRISFDILLAPYQNRVAVSHGRMDTARWMSPLKVFEYMASRKPIICSDMPVLAEILKHNHNALLCPADDVEAWGQALELLNNDRNFGARLADAAYSDFVLNYTWPARAEKIIEAIKESID